MGVFRNLTLNAKKRGLMHQVLIAWVCAVPFLWHRWCLGLVLAISYILGDVGWSARST